MTCSSCYKEAFHGSNLPPEATHAHACTDAPMYGHTHAHGVRAHACTDARMHGHTHAHGVHAHACTDTPMHTALVQIHECVQMTMRTHRGGYTGMQPCTQHRDMPTFTYRHAHKHSRAHRYADTHIARACQNTEGCTQDPPKCTPRLYSTAEAPPQPPQVCTHTLDTSTTCWPVYWCPRGAPSLGAINRP